MRCQIHLKIDNGCILQTKVLHVVKDVRYNNLGLVRGNHSLNGHSAVKFLLEFDEHSTVCVNLVIRRGE